MDSLSYANAIVDAMNAGGYRVEVDPDLTALLQAILRHSDKRWGNPEFDPLLHGDAVGPDRAFWIRVHSRDDDQLVGFAAARFMPSGDLLAMSRDYSFWYGPAVTIHSRLEVTADASVAPDPSAGWVHYGAGWVHKDHRGKGLIWFVCRILRGIALARWRHAYDFAFTAPALAASGHPIWGQGYAHQAIFARDYWRPGLPTLDVHLAWRAGTELMAQIEGEAVLLETDRDIRPGPAFHARLKTLSATPARPVPGRAG